MSTPIRNILDVPGRVNTRTKLLNNKLSAALDVGEGWVNKHIQIWRSYVEKPAKKLHENVQNRSTRLEYTLKEAGKAVPHPFRVLK